MKGPDQNSSWDILVSVCVCVCVCWGVDVQEPCSGRLQAWTCRTKRTDSGRTRDVTQHEGAMMGRENKESQGQSQLLVQGLDSWWGH